MARIGKYRNRVLVLRRQLAAADSFGDEVESWPTAGAVAQWAQVDWLSGDERLAGPVRQSTVTHRIAFRKPVTIDPTDRLQIESTGEVLTIDGLFRTLREVVCHATLHSAAE